MPGVNKPGLTTRKERLLDQLELALDELTASATEDELAAGKAAAWTTEVKGFVRRKPSRKPFPEHLPRERVVVPAPTSCACCGSDRLSKVGEDVTETLEVSRRPLTSYKPMTAAIDCPTRSAAASISRSPRWA